MVSKNQKLFKETLENLACSWLHPRCCSNHCPLCSVSYRSLLTIAVRANNLSNDSILGAYKIQTQSYLDSIDLKSTEGNLSIEFNVDSTIHLEYRNGPLVYPDNGSDFRKFQLHDFETSLYMEDDAQDLKLLTTTNTWFTSSRPQTKYWFDIKRTESQQNDENLIQLLQNLLNDDEVKLRIKGSPKVKLDGMPREYKVKWDKTITMNGPSSPPCLSAPTYEFSFSTTLSPVSYH